MGDQEHEQDQVSGVTQQVAIGICKELSERSGETIPLVPAILGHSIETLLPQPCTEFVSCNAAHTLSGDIRNKGCDGLLRGRM